MAYLQDRVCLSRCEQRGLWGHRLQLVWPSGGQQNLGRRDVLPQFRAVGQPVSGASFRQQVSIGVASVVQVPLTHANRPRSSRLASRCYSTANLSPRTSLAHPARAFHHFEAQGTLRYAGFRRCRMGSSTFCVADASSGASLGEWFNKLSHACTRDRTTGSLSLNWLTPNGADAPDGLVRSWRRGARLIWNVRRTRRRALAK